jgi:PPK2 family polyphosphate:nucleotide phosphotransferase
MNLSDFLAEPKKEIKLSDFDTNYSYKYNSKEEAAEKLNMNIQEMSELQNLLYAQDRWSLLIIIQAMDAAGKDGTIKHVMSGLNPQGTQVYSFKQPSIEELDHNYLWRFYKTLPERGRIGIFNRSYYEDVLVVKVHNLLEVSKLPQELITEDIWEKRYKQMKDFEKNLFENGTKVIKFFLNVSKKEQKKRFLRRIEDPSRNWKFSEADVRERKLWKEYQNAYEKAISGTSTDFAPWYIIPGDKKWFARLAVSEIIIDTLKSFKAEYPKLSDVQLKNLETVKQELLNEADD